MRLGIEPVKPIFTAHLLPIIDGKLVELLRTLTPLDWRKQTLAPKWKVKDVAAHLLDTQVRKIAASRSAHPAASSKLAPNELLALINSLNDEGIRKYGQLNPDELIAQLEVAAKDSAAYHRALDPFGPAMFPVSWAGEEESANWFDTAREFTERWHHQQQIRVAVDKPGIMTRELYHPVLDCFLRGLPYCYRDVPASDGVLVQFNITGDCGGSWYLVKTEKNWSLNALPVGQKVAEVEIPQEIAWRIFTKGISREAAAGVLRAVGDPELGRHVLNLVAIVG